MHKILQIISIGAVAATVAATGFQAGPASASAVRGLTITFAGFSSRQGIAPILKKLNEQYAGKYVFKNDPYPYNTYGALLSAAIEGGTTPDVFGASWTPSVYYAREGLELPILPILHDAGIKTSDFASSMWSTNTEVNGVHYAVPQDAFGMDLYYNKALFKKAGLNPADPPTTGAQIVADALAMKKGGIKYPMILGVGKNSQAGLFPSLVWQWGGQMGDPKTCAALFDSKAGVAAATWEKNLIYKYKVAPVGPSTGEDIAEFGKGAVGMIINGAGLASSFKTELGANFGFEHLPKIGPVNDTEFLGQEYLWVFKTAATTTPQGQEGVAILLKAIYNQDLPIIVKQTGLVPAYRPVLVTMKSSIPFFAQHNLGVELGRVNPAIPNWGTVTAVPLYNNFEDVLLNRTSVSAGLHEAMVQTDELTKTLPGCSD